MSSYYPNKRAMMHLKRGKLILDEWYPFLKAIDSIEEPDSLKTFAPFRDVWRQVKNYDEVVIGKFTGPNNPEKQHLIRREGGTGEMFFFARALQEWVDDMWHEHRDAFQTPTEVLEAYQQYSIRYTSPLLWDRPGWYIECVQPRRVVVDDDGLEAPMPRYLAGNSYPWPMILIGYATNAHARDDDDRIVSQPTPTGKRNPVYENDFKSIHCMCIEYTADGNMQYRLIWEQSGDQAQEELVAEEGENTWAEPSGGEDFPAIIPVTVPINKLFWDWVPRSMIVNFPFTSI